jgi:hypothetical protein
MTGDDVREDLLARAVAQTADEGLGRALTVDVVAGLADIERRARTGMAKARNRHLGRLRAWLACPLHREVITLTVQTAASVVAIALAALAFRSYPLQASPPKEGLSISNRQTQHQSGTRTTTTVADDAALVSITPSNGSRRAKPNRGVTVRVAHGKLQTVKVTAGHDSADGTISQDGTSWHSLWPLRTGTQYTVTATAVGSNGKIVTATSTFRTLHPAATFTASTILDPGTYGVGMPISINFSLPVSRRYQAAVEKAVNITTSKPVVGAWYWDGNQTLDFRTRQYWPQHTKVSFNAHFDGIEVAPGVYGTANLSQSFEIGRRSSA